MTKNKDGLINQAKYILIELKNEQQNRERLKKFAERRANAVSKLAIVRKIKPVTFGLEYSLLEDLIARPFNSGASELLVANTGHSSPRNRSFFQHLNSVLSASG